MRAEEFTQGLTEDTIDEYHAEKGEGKGVAEGLMWYDTDERLSVDDRMAIIESYYLSKSQTLTESNDKAMSDYFISLTSMSDKPTKNGKFLMVFLGLLNNKVHQLSYPEIVTILAKQGNEYTVELEDGTTKKIPSKNIRDKLVAATFFFNNDKAFDKFRTIMSLKFDMDFAEYSEYVPAQGVAEELDEACWKGYHKEGTKKMFGKTYPNCVKNKKKKTNESEQGEKCPHCGGPIFTEMQIAEEKDACYRKVKSRYKIWPSAYASGALVRCRKVGAKNWGNKGKK